MRNNPVTQNMSAAERQQFLSALHVGVLALNRPGSGPLTVPVWYDYEPGGALWFITDRDSRKGRLIDIGTRISVCVQNEAPPYQYVCVEGPVVAIVPSNVTTDLQPMARRYLGAVQGNAYAAGAKDGDSVVVRMRCATWLSVDYSKR